MDDKPSLKGAWLRHVTRFKFWGPIHISRMAEAKALKFCTKEDYIKSCQKDDKSPLKGAWFCSHDPSLYTQLEQNHAPFRGDLSSFWQDLIWSLFVQNLRALASAETIAMINMYTKYEVSMFTHYEVIKATKNAKIRVVWGLGVTQGHQKYRHLIQCI